MAVTEVSNASNWIADRKTSRGASRAAGLFPVLVIAFAIVAQGGFFNGVTCVCGVVVGFAGFASLVRKRNKGKGVGLVSLLFCGVAAAYAISAAVNGLSVSSLSEAGAWFAVAGMSLYAFGMDGKKREQAFSKLVWLGAIAAAMGLLVFGEVVSIPGGVDDNRLQFTFQYANAAAGWFSVAALLSLLCPEKRLRCLAVLPVSALLLTESAGAILVFLLSCAIVCVGWLRDGKKGGQLFYALVSCIVGIAVFAVCRWFGMVGSIVGMMLAVATCAALYRSQDDIMKAPKASLISKVLLVAIGVAAVLSLVVLSDRVLDASGNMVERLYHAKDGLMLWLTSPLLGIGPDQWQYAYPFAQSAQYHTTVVHNSFVQIMVDGGLFSIVCLLAACVMGIRFSRKQKQDSWGPVVALAICFLMVHSLLDFDLQFGSIALLLAFFLSDPDGPTIRAPRAIGPLLCLAVCVPFAAVGVLCELSSLSLTLANSMDDSARAQEMFEGNSLAQRDVSCQTQYLLACYNQQDFRSIARYCDSHGAASDEQAIYASIAFMQLGRVSDSTNALIDLMERQPFNDEYFDNAKMVVDLYGYDADAVDRWNAAVDNANSCEQGVSRLLHTQRSVSTYLER